jgi:hypothetical protein
MFVMSNCDLENDIKYLQSIFNKCNSNYETFEENLKNANKVYSERMKFVKSQFQNAFYNSLDV